MLSSEEENSSEEEVSSEEESDRYFDDEPLPPQPIKGAGSDSEEGQQASSSHGVKRKRAEKSVGNERKKKPAAKKEKINTLGAPETQPLIDEKAHEAEPATATSDAEKKITATKASGKKEPKLFNDKNIDIDLYDSDPDKIVVKKIRLNKSVILSCKTIETVNQTGAKLDWAAVILEKRMKGDLCYDFNMSLALVPVLIEGLKKIVQANPKYFQLQNQH